MNVIRQRMRWLSDSSQSLGRQLVRTIKIQLLILLALPLAPAIEWRAQTPGDTSSLRCAFSLSCAYSRLAGALNSELRAETLWSRLGEDLEIAYVKSEGGTLFSPQILLVRTSLKRFGIRVIRATEYSLKTSGVKNLCRKSQSSVCINANFFDELYRPLGLIISRGIMHQAMHRGGQTLTGVFQVSRNDMKVVSREDFSPTSVVEAVQAGPRLLSDGEAVAGLRDNHSASQRAGLCIDQKGRLVFFGSFSGLVGVTMDQIRTVLMDPDVACRDALNLDGGGSAQIYISNNIPDSSTDLLPIDMQGHDEVPVALGLFVKE
jgi:uncharacterized protein YigE (DUF2233 family)